jgi:hypothetical protein
MHLCYIKAMLVALIFSLPPLFVYAAEGKTSESFQAICLDSWMNRYTEVKDKVAYKNFGEKYCNCAQTQPLDNDSAVDKAIHVCISRTLLHDTMDALKTSIGLNKVTDKDIIKHCQERWNLIYPKLTDNGKQATIAFCECSKTQLMDLQKKVNEMTDKEYNEQSDTIAAACSGTVKPDAK